VDFEPERLASSLSAIDGSWRQARHCVALSGGLDSTVLLHAMAALLRGPALRAIHVDHGLQPESVTWANACRALCEQAGVPLEVVSLSLAPPAGASVEAAAREARYAALADRLQPDERLLTAHHRDDQFETVLIQLLRGAGVAGLAAMPARAPLGHGWHLRPLLDVDRAAIEAYARRHGLAWIDDPMNDALRYDRGWLRARVLPAIRERWPAAPATVARSATHVAEAARVLEEVAEADAAGLVDDGRLSVEGLRLLSHDRRFNLLRWWLAKQGLRAPPSARLASAMEAFLTARPDALPALRWDSGEVRRYRGRLYALLPLAPLPAAVSAGTPQPFDLGSGLGRIALVESLEGGLPLTAARSARIRFRAGGESLRPHLQRPRKRLKDLCQESGVVPWMRDRLPLVYLDDRLAAVGDLWIDAELAVPAGESSLKPVWIDRPALF
jgi:tRNA(Ile)-lysidine synthase